jgi:hypothetical protein
MVKVGYYPGDPIPRPPKGVKPTPLFGSADIESWVNNFEMGVADVPETVKEWVVNDIKRSLKVSGDIKGDFNVQTALLYGDIDQVPGTQLQVNLNPQDWYKDPQKEARKTLESWGKSIINWHDLYDYVEKEYFYEPILAGRDRWKPYGDTSEGPFGLAGEVDDLAKSLVGYNDPYPGGLKPYQLFESGIKRAAPWTIEHDVVFDPVKGNYIAKAPKDASGNSIMPEVDVGTEAAGAKISFHQRVEQAAQRNSQFNSLRKKYGMAVREELLGRYGVRDDDGNFIGIVAAAGLDSEQRDQFLAFSALMDVSDAVETLARGDLGKSGLTGLSDALYKMHSEGSGALDINFNLLDFEDGVNEKGELVTFWSKIAALDHDTRGFKASIDKGRAKLSGNSAALEAYNKRVQELEEIYDEAYDIIKSLKDRNIDLNSAVARQVLGDAAGRMNKLRDRLTQPGFFNKGFEFGLYEDIERVINGGANPLVDGTSASLMNKSISDAGVRAVGPQNTLIRNVQVNLRDDRISFNYNDISDISDVVEKGKVMETYFYQRVKRRIEPFTPAYHVRKVVTSLHGLGLVYDQDEVDRKVRKQIALSSDYKTKEDRAQLFLGSNIAEKDPIARFMPKNMITVMGGRGQVKLQGGRHLATVEDVNKMFKTVMDSSNPSEHKGKLGALLNPRTGALIGFRDFDPSNPTDLIRFLNARKFEDFAGLGVTFLPNNDLVNANLIKIGFLRSYLYANRDALGLKFRLENNVPILIDDAENLSVLSNIMVSLSSRMAAPHAINITWERVGLLQKLTVQSNKLQSALMKKIAPYVAPYVKAKKALAAALSQLLINATAGVSGGLGGLLQSIKPIIDKLMVWVLTRVEKLFTTVLKALNPLNEKSFFTIEPWVASLEKMNSALAKIAVAMIAVPLSLLVVIAGLFLVIITAISPIDPTRSGSQLGSAFGGMGGVFPVDCSTPVDGNFDALGEGTHAIAERSRLIAADLQTGFWCYWNKHPNYEKFWNQAMYDANPNPGSDFSCANCLFWCTYLVIESYNDSSVPLPRDLINSENMAIHFGYDPKNSAASKITPTWKYISNIGDNPGTSQYGVRAGDVIFFKTPARQYYRIAHVAVVHSVTPDYIETIHSNSSLKRWTFPRNDDGSVQDEYTFFEVYGFGRYQ